MLKSEIFIIKSLLIWAIFSKFGTNSIFVINAVTLKYIHIVFTSKMIEIMYFFREYKLKRYQVLTDNLVRGIDSYNHEELQ